MAGVVKAVTLNGAAGFVMIAKGFIPEMGAKSFAIMEEGPGMRGQRGSRGRRDDAGAARAQAFTMTAAR
jgi:hypothetical protein